MTDRVDKALEICKAYLKSHKLCRELYNEVLKIADKFTPEELEEYYDKKNRDIL